MKLHQLRDLIAVADTGSLRAAARQLNIAQSAITKSVRLLEKELDVPLLERNKRGVVLTPMGVLFLQRARAASGELVKAQEEIRQHRGDGSGRVVVSLSTVPHISLLPAVIDAFSKRYPDVRLTILEALGFSAADVQLKSGVVDAYIGVQPTTKLSSEFVVESLFENQRCVIARTGHPFANATSLGQLVGERWLVSNSTYAESSFMDLFRRNKFEAPTRLTYAGSILSQLILLLNSDTLMIAPMQVLDFEPYGGRLCKVLVRERIEAPRIVMVRRAALPLTPAADHFCDLIRRAAVSMSSSPPRPRSRQRAGVSA